MPQNYPTAEQLEEMERKKKGPGLVEQMRRAKLKFAKWSGSNYANAATEAQEELERIKEEEKKK